MESTIFFDDYRLANKYDGSPIEIGRVGEAVVYKASDLRSGAPVALTLLPIESIAPEQRARFEEEGRASLLLDHVNVVRTVEFGRAGNDFAFVSEYPPGETLAAWISDNGPMPPDAVLRVALQIIRGLSAAGFQGISPRGIEPSNVIILTGQTAEGDWPSVKWMSFPGAGLTPTGAGNVAATEFASPEQLKEGTADFRSAIYSLGATMCFLLTGAFYSAEPRSLQTRRFARPLRKLITPMLRQNPDERPQDPTLVTEQLLACLQHVERRQDWSRKFGIPFVPVSVPHVPKRRVVQRPKSILSGIFAKPGSPIIPQETVARPRRVWARRVLAVAAVLLAAATIAAMLLPAPVSMLLRRDRDRQEIGVPVGVVQQPSAAAVTQNSSAPARDSIEAPPATTPPHAAMAVVPSTNQNPPAVVENSAPSPAPQITAATAPTDNAPTPASKAAAGSDVSTASAREATAGDTEAQPPAPAGGPQTVWERAAGSSAQPRIAQQNEAPSPQVPDGEPTNRVADQPNELNSDRNSGADVVTRSHNTKPKRIDALSTPLPSRRDQSVAQIPRERPEHRASSVVRGSVRARFAGMTPDGSVILRFPDGQTAIVPPPPGAYVPSQLRVRRPRRVIIERRTVMPPPPYALALPSDD